MNSTKLAEENVKASLLKKMLNLSVLNCCKWSVVLYKLFQSGTVFKDFTDVQAEESDFSNIGVMCKSDQNEDTFSVCFDELEHYFTGKW